VKLFFLVRHCSGSCRGLHTFSWYGFSNLGLTNVPTHLPIDELRKVTQGFGKEIGRGAGGIVYKGVSSDDRGCSNQETHRS